MQAFPQRLQAKPSFAPHPSTHRCLLGSAQWRQLYYDSPTLSPAVQRFCKLLGRWESLSGLFLPSNSSALKQDHKGSKEGWKAWGQSWDPVSSTLPISFLDIVLFLSNAGFQRALVQPYSRQRVMPAGSWRAQARLHGNGSPRPDHPVEFSDQLTAFLGLENKATTVTPCSVERGSAVQRCCCC